MVTGTCYMMAHPLKVALSIRQGSQRGSLSMRLKRDFSSWLSFCAVSESPNAGKCASRHRNASLVYASGYKRDVGFEPHGCAGIGVDRTTIRHIFAG